MRREQFGEWGKSLSEPDFWRAVAILGAAQYDVNLTRVHLEGLHLQWKLPDPIVPNLPSEFCLGLWHDLQIVRPIRLALTTFYDNQSQINQNFRSYAAASLYLQMPFPSLGLRWHWPVRIGFLTDPNSRTLQNVFLTEREKHETLQTLTEISSVDESNSFEFLIVPAPVERALRMLNQSPVTVRAHCLILFSGLAGEFSQLTAIVRRTHSAGVLFHSDSLHPAEVFSSFVWNLSHDLPIDEADPNGTLFATSELLPRARISRFLQTVAERLVEAGDEPIPVPRTMATRFQHLPKLYPGALLGYELAERLKKHPDSIFDRERHGATWSVELDRDLRLRSAIGAAEEGATLEAAAGEAAEEGAAGEGAAGEGAAPGGFHIRPAAVEAENVEALSESPEPGFATWPPPERFLQARLPDLLRQNLTTKIGVFIAPAQSEAIVANYRFPDESLDSEEEGHLLTVLFSEPKLLEKPLVETLYLPRTGSSNTAEFEITTGASFESLEARITVLYQNRILQTSLLRASLASRPTLTMEMNVRPGLQGLDQQRRFDAAVILNHSTTGDATATAGAGYNFATFSLVGLDRMIEKIEGRIDTTPWADSDYKTLDAPGSEQLLRFLARHGASLYHEFLRYVPDPERLRKATHVQVVARENASRLPIELFYGRTPPLPEAKLCGNWRDALENGACPPACQDSASVICPLGFWCLSRVLEWHRFDIKTANETEGRAFALRDRQPGQRQKSLPELKSAVLALSARVDRVVGDTVQTLRVALQKRFGADLSEARSWKEWATQIQEHSPSLLVLLPHTEEDEDQVPTMEISNDALASENLKREHVLGPKGDPQPIVLLFGCNTDNKGLPHESFVSYFSDHQAAVVVSSISKVLGRHAAPLVRDFIERILALPRTGDRTIGEVMRELRRHALLDGPPVALVLKTYGDADWRI